jgi:hypothetical protein
MMPQENGNLFASWGFADFALTFLSAVVTAVGTFVYRMSVRVKLLEDGAEMREENTERRHKENLAAWNRIDDRVAQLTQRLDTVVDRGQNLGRRS